MSGFHQPLTQIFKPQIMDDKHILHVNPNISPKSKPIAKVNPIDKVNPKLIDQYVQTEPTKTEIEYLMSREDYFRSSRQIGKSNLKHSENQINVPTLNPNELKEKYIELDKQLQKQLSINSDLKKLLVASMGNDLADMFAKMTKDVSDLNNKIGNLLSERQEEQQDAEDSAIEAGVWRHKFLAGRVLLAETAEWKSQLEDQHNEAIRTIESLLREQQRLRQSIALSTSSLHEILDLFNQKSYVSHHQHHSNMSSISLAEQNHLLTNHLLNFIRQSPDFIKSASKSNQYPQSITSFTDAEESALHVLKSRNIPTQFLNVQKAISSSLHSSEAQNMETMISHICRNCKGDVFVV